ncbi:MAG TPA: hypothetical protein VGI23_24570 [Steroidobacteraceae bacterium]
MRLSSALEIGATTVKLSPMSSPPPDPPTWNQISAALDEGLDLSTADREIWLEASLMLGARSTSWATMPRHQ